MGAALYRWSPRTTIDRLEQVERQILEFEEKSQKIQQRKTSIIQNFTAIFILIYLGLITYYLTGEFSWIEQMLWLLMMMSMPVFIAYTRSIVKWWYQEKAALNYSKLEKLYNQKQQLLKTLMERNELMTNSHDAGRQHDELTHQSHSSTALMSFDKLRTSTWCPEDAATPALSSYFRSMLFQNDCGNYNGIAAENRLKSGEQLKQVFKHLASTISDQNGMAKTKKWKAAPVHEENSSTAWPCSSEEQLCYANKQHHTTRKLHKESKTVGLHQTRVRRRQITKSNEPKIKSI